VIRGAYAYAQGDGPLSDELLAGQLITRFGAQAVYGRSLGYGELRRIWYAEAVVSAYHERARASDWVAWAQQNPQLNSLLLSAMNPYD